MCFLHHVHFVSRRFASSFTMGLRCSRWFFHGGQAIVRVECWHLRGEMHCWENGRLVKADGRWTDGDMTWDEFKRRKLDGEQCGSQVRCRSWIPVRRKWLSQGDETLKKQWSCGPRILALEVWRMYSSLDCRPSNKQPWPNIPSSLVFTDALKSAVI